VIEDEEEGEVIEDEEEAEAAADAAAPGSVCIIYLSEQKTWADAVPANRAKKARGKGVLVLQVACDRRQIVYAAVCALHAYPIVCIPTVVQGFSG
jgi:hypothetical protein